ncbi:MAG: flagellar biosynthesis protein FlhA [Gammaproteobacteria bacterium]|nr:flagellar biosynthesis protein FlhA [Gammaproteobacteria bacterium]MDH5802642.1 flagellar biosynthesis protein FlhA [Gammaproteobacteria bacterium]
MIPAIRHFLQNGLGTPILVIVILAMMVVPLPAFLLDILFSFNISLALVILLAGVYVQRPLQFAVFPTVLLLATLLRLSLNIASTRVVLLEGHTGTDAAGKVIQAFGEFVVGGNTAVGLVIFMILVIINFVVVTKGATRVAEVSARFTLDSMPGKQMAIDADLNAGTISQEEAKERRDEVAQEADFYGSMDGAGKFVRGDAVAGILILIITVIGGLGVGILQHGLDFSDAIQKYTLLTIGDGLVAQIPSLLLSTAAGLMVTRVSSSQDMSAQVVSQLFDNPKALAVTAAILGTMGLIPGMPNLAFLVLSGACGYGAYWRSRRQLQQAELPERAAPVEAPQEPKELSWDDVTPVDLIGLEVGYRLIPLVDKNQGGQLMTRIKGVRKKLSQELGFLIPPVHIRDNLDLAPNQYRITLMGANIGESELHPDRDMAINPGQTFGVVQGIASRDPAFGLEAVWVEASQKEQAQSLGYTVVDASTVAATHLSQLLQTHADELLGHEEVQHLLNNLTKFAPKLVEDLVPKVLPLGVVVKVMQNLLAEGVSIRDIRTIAETLAEYAPASQDAGMLTAAVRVALGRSIVQQVAGTGELGVMTLAPNLEHILHQSVSGGADSTPSLEPGLADNLIKSLAEQSQRQEASGHTPVLLVAASIRAMLARFVRHSIPNLRVLAFNEIPDNKQIKITATVGAM